MKTCLPARMHKCENIHMCANSLQVPPTKKACRVARVKSIYIYYIMCVCKYVCMHTHTHARTHIRTHAHTHIRIHIHAHSDASCMSYICTSAKSVPSARAWHKTRLHWYKHACIDWLRLYVFIHVCVYQVIRHGTHHFKYTRKYYAGVVRINIKTYIHFNVYAYRWIPSVG